MESERIFYVGLLHFGELFSQELVERLNHLDILRDIHGKRVKIIADHIFIHEVSLDYKTKYHMIVDRGSHILKHAVGIFMAFAFKGIYLINNPLSFHYFISKKDVGYSIAHDLGINIPKTYILPSKITPSFKQKDFLYHLNFNWDEICNAIGFPCYIKPADGRGAIGVNKVNNKEELLHYYNTSGTKIMTVQAEVPSPHNWHVRCLCVGKTIIPIKFIFQKHDQSKYIYEENFLNEEQGKRIVDTARILNQIFGYEMNSVEFILDHDGVPWAIDFNNPVPDGRIDSLGHIFYMDYMSAMIKRICEVACDYPPYYFLPNINRFSRIAQLDIPKEEKFLLALKIANKYYL